ncbi:MULTISPECIES: helix-turn-helix domain-containing protein [Mumia]|uniref:helix-turn-helix domain-containing protein n=1 Tax=Mumia TaxID=1546255 RepID=UPI00326682B8
MRAEGLGVTARQLVDSLEMPRATTYRLLEHLVQCPDVTGFALGRRVRDLARAADARGEEVES